MGGAGEEIEGFCGEDAVVLAQFFEVAAQGGGVAGNIKDPFRTIIIQNRGGIFLQPLSRRVENHRIGMRDLF